MPHGPGTCVVQLEPLQLLMRWVSTFFSTAVLSCRGLDVSCTIRTCSCQITEDEGVLVLNPDNFAEAIAQVRDRILEF